MNDANFDLRGETGLRQGDDPLPVPQESEGVPEHVQGQSAIRKSSLDTIAPDVPLLSFHHDLNNGENDSIANFGPSLLRLEAQIGGRIKLPEHGIGAGKAASDPNELTFYRRNLFKVSARVYLTDAGAATLVQRGLVKMVARLDSIESIEGEPVKLIKIPIKNDAACDDSTAKGEAVQPILLDHKAVDASGQATLDMCWDRLQFRRATTKTRGSVAQRYQLRVSIAAVNSDRSEETIARVASEFIVVRGRSPKNYPDQSKGQYFPAKLGGNSLSPTIRRESTSKPTPSEFQQRTTGSRSVVPATDRGTNSYFSTRQQPEAQPLSTSRQVHTVAANAPEITDLDLYSDGSEGSSSTDMLATNLATHTSIPTTTVDVATKSLAHQTANTQNWLALRDAEQPFGGLLLPTLRRQMSKTAARDSTPAAPNEEEQDSYEYIPLSINDWSTPVDPVYVS